jgi:Cellulose binding domain/Bacterial Ig domain/Right handed beta helix region
MFRRSLFTLFFVASSSQALAATWNVDTTEALQSALANVQAGDEIVLTAGKTFQYTNGAIDTAYFFSSANGTATRPITIRSASATNLATIRGNDVTSKILLRITGDYWVVKDLKFTNGQKGLVFDNSNYSKAINCEITAVGMEGIHIRDGSDHVLIDGCWVYNTGLFNPQFGEGVYIGSDRSVWTTYNSSVDYTVVQNSTIGPDVRAEMFDIKEGTAETIVQNNEIYGKGISAAAFEDSFIDLKGTRTYVRYNTFHQGGEPKIKRAIAVIDRDTVLSSYEHAVHDNVFNMDDATTPLLEAYSGTSEIYAYNNTRNPAGTMYTSSVKQSKPSWYSAPGGGGGGNTNQPPNVAITSAVGDLIAGRPVTISATASDSDGSVADVAFYRDGVLIGRDASSPYSVVWASPAAGTYNLTAIATDNDAATRTSSGFPITIASSGGGGGGTGLVVQYQRGDANATDNRIRAHFIVKNTGTSSVNLSELKLRYWFTREGTGTPVFNVDYAAIGAANVSGSFVNTGGSAYYAELSFGAGAGTLAPGKDTGAIKVRITTTTNADQTESNDYSFGESVTTFQDWKKVGLYRGGSLIWGVSP